ncbi:phosphoribosylaminoimidazole carboxylase ATPase subunit [compost metagenome]
MVNVLGEHMDEVVQGLMSGAWIEGNDQNAAPDVVPKVHLYGKSGSAAKRKMGHINLLCDNVQEGMNFIQQTKIWRNQQS